MKGNKLTDAMERVNVDMVQAMEHGEEIVLNNEYTLYKYAEEDIVMLLKSEEWEEVASVVINGELMEFEMMD